MPPPAPSVCTASIGVPTSCPAIRPLLVSLARPSAITLMSVLVPPISKVTRLRRAVVRASALPATTPAAGPEIRVWLGKRAPMVMRIKPPFDCIRKTCGVVTPRALSRWSRLTR